MAIKHEGYQHLVEKLAIFKKYRFIDYREETQHVPSLRIEL